jgi:TonB family protein
MRATAHGAIFIALFATSTLWLVASPATAMRSDQSAQRPMPNGRMIDARDGDTIVLDGDERIRIVHRTRAIVRAVFNEPAQWLVLLVDVAHADSDPDGRVDLTYNFRDLTGHWPLGARWDGEAVIEEHSGAPQSPNSYVVRTAQGVIHLLSGNPYSSVSQDPTVTAVLNYRGAGCSTSSTMTFDQAEQRAIAGLQQNIATNAERARQGLPSMSTFSSEGQRGNVATGGLVGPYIAGRPGTASLAPSGPVRVGSRIATPRKIHDVAPVLPDLARRAGVRGMVVLELTVGADGAVTNATVLRSIPLLDQTALDAARQWRYEPTLVNDQPVPIILTATVIFE